jgi:hypothetical protein
MSLDPPFTDWTDPPLPAKRLAPLRLAAIDGGVALYRASLVDTPKNSVEHIAQPHTAVLTPTLMTGKAPPEIAFALAFPMTPHFDVVERGNGTLAVATEFYVGASHSLVLGRAVHNTLETEDQYADSTDYRLPRFIRGAVTPGSMVTAVVNRTHLAAVIGKPLPLTEIGRTPAPVATLAEADSGLVVATTPPNGTQMAAALFAKRQHRGQALPNGDRPGTLTVRQLTGIKPSGTPQTLFTAGETYSFDTDAHDALALVLGSTKDGPQLLRFDLGSGKTVPIAWPNGYPASGTWIANPSVLAVPGGNSFAVAFYEITARGGMGIRMAQLKLT